MRWQPLEPPPAKLAELRAPIPEAEILNESRSTGPGPAPGSQYQSLVRSAGPEAHASKLAASALRSGKQGDALDAVLLARVRRPLGDELVRVPADLLDLEAGRLDRLPIGVFLGRAADAGGPEVGVADDRLLELPLADDVGDREAPARPKDPRRLGEHALLLRPPAPRRRHQVASKGEGMRKRLDRGRSIRLGESSYRCLSQSA